MESNKFEGNEKLEFRQIVLGHIKKILEISSHELRNMTYTVFHGNHDETKYEEDTRISYVQAIENLAYILIPYFDDDMNKIYIKSTKIINSYDFQIQKIFEQEIKEICKELGKDSLRLPLYCIDKKIESAKKLFVELNRLLKRVDYLKNVIYGEDFNSEEVVEEKEESEE